MLKKISISTLLLLAISSTALIAQREIRIPVGDTTIIYSRLIAFNEYAEAAGVDILSETEYSNTTYLRLWAPLNYSPAARLLNIKIQSNHIEGKWYATWRNDFRQTNKKELYEKWNCISEIETISANFGTRSGCLIAQAESDEIESIRDLVFETDFIALLHEPLEERAQIDGKSLIVELLNQNGYRFVSFMNYHIDHHPRKDLIKEARTVLSLWHNKSGQ